MIVLSATFFSFSQIKRCGTTELYDIHRQQNPVLDIVREQMEIAGKKWRENPSLNKNGNSLITIPVVVHVVYNADSLQQNIPDSCIFSQLEVLNEDFRRLNADSGNVRSLFDSLASDIQIEFCFASTDTNGNPTNGITRTATSVKAFEFFNNQQDDMKFTSKGGEDAWSKDKYLNIWTCYMTIFNSPGVLGYSHFPWDTADSKDGVVLLYNTVGRYNKVFEMPEGKGKTATHEVGHWFGLFHIWGNESFFPGCDSSDYVDDTPNQSGQSNFDCNKTINSCSNESPFWNPFNPPDLVENYMDYSNDTCMCMFSSGQKDRMLSFLNTARAALFNSNGCAGFSAAPEFFNNDFNFRISPNPSVGNVVVFSSSNQKEQKADIEILNLLGQKIFKKNNAGIPMELNLSSLPSGYYFIEISNGKTQKTLPLILSERK